MSRVWLQEGHDKEPGVEAWALDVLGFATWAATRAELLERIPRKLADHSAWLQKHGLPVPSVDSEVEILEHVTGNEILFGPDRSPATPWEIDQTLHLLQCSRFDLLSDLEHATDALLDWDPPYRRFASWADWRTIRANLAHIANSETHYYARNIGYRSPSRPVEPGRDWKGLLARSRAESIRFLEELRGSDDLARVTTVDWGFGEEDWSVRKALRRMVRHEITHWKSIRRIMHDYGSVARPGGSLPSVSNHPKGA